MGLMGVAGIYLFNRPIDHCLYSIASGLMLFPVLFRLALSIGPLRGSRSSNAVDYPSCLVHNGARRIEHKHLLMNSTRLKVTAHAQATPFVTVTLSRNSSAPKERCVLLWWYVRLNEHLAELFQFLRATNFLRK